MTPRPLVLAVNAVATLEGDGIVGDAAVLYELDCRAACVATSILATTPSAVLASEALPAETIGKQIEAVTAFERPAGARIGHLLDPSQVALIGAVVLPLVPETSVYAPIVRLGESRVLDAATLAAARRELFARVRVVVVRCADSEELAGVGVSDFASLRAAAEAVRSHGARAAIVGGFVSRGRVVDLIDDGGTVTLLDTSRIQAPHVPGLTGAYAAALAAHLARGAALAQAAESAQRYMALRLTRGR